MEGNLIVATEPVVARRRCNLLSKAWDEALNRCTVGVSVERTAGDDGAGEELGASCLESDRV